jgi:hypothetical protein
MVYHASPSSAPSAHLHVSYTSHPHSKDVNNFTGAYCEPDDHSKAGGGFGNLEARMTGLETEVHDFKTEISHKIDVLGIKFESSQKEMARAHEKQLASFTHDQQKQFSHFYARSFFGVSLTLHIIYQLLT